MALYQFWGAAADPGQALERLGLYFMGWRTHRHGVLTWVPRGKLAGMAPQELKLVPHFPSSLGRGDQHSDPGDPPVVSQALSWVLRKLRGGTVRGTGEGSLAGGETAWAIPRSEESSPGVCAGHRERRAVVGCSSEPLEGVWALPGGLWGIIEP